MFPLYVKVLCEDIVRGPVGPTFPQLNKTQRIWLMSLFSPCCNLWRPQSSKCPYVPRRMWMANDLEAVTSSTAWQVNTGLFWQDFPVGCCSRQQFCYDTNDSGSPRPQLERSHATQAWASWKNEKYLLSQSGFCAAGLLVLGEICALRIWFSESKRTWVSIWMVDKLDSGVLALEGVSFMKLPTFVTQQSDQSGPIPYFHKFNEILKGERFIAQCLLFSAKHSRLVQY